MAINYQDPRFQRQLLEAQAKKGTGAMIDTAGITAEFAGQQQAVHNQFAQMGLRKYLFEQELKLDESKLAFNRKMFDQELAAKGDELFFGLVGGLGTSVVAALEGRRRRIEKQKTARMIK
jgi:hypothetical protein